MRSPACLTYRKAVARPVVRNSGRIVGVMAGLLLLQSGCGKSDPGQVSFAVSAPDAGALSPLVDPRTSALEVQKAQTAEVLGHASFNPLGQQQGLQLDLGS